MSGTSFPWIDASLLAALVAAAILLGIVLFMLRQRRIELDSAVAALGSERDRIRLALEGSSLAIWDWDIAADSIWLDASWQEMLGGHAEDTRAPMAEVFSLVHADDIERVKRAAVDSFKAEVGQFDAEFRVRGFDVKRFPRWATDPLPDEARDTIRSAFREAGIVD